MVDGNWFIGLLAWLVLLCALLTPPVLLAVLVHFLRRGRQAGRKDERNAE